MSKQKTYPVVGIIVCFAAGLAAIIIGGSFIFKDLSLKTSGIEVTGEVISKSRKHVSNVEYGSSELFSVKYRFSVGGQTYTGRSQVSASAYREISEGQKIDVIHSIHNPEISSLKEGKAKAVTFGPILFCVVGLIFVILGFVITADTLKRKKITHHLKQEG
jgi:hypothetical protein